MKDCLIWIGQSYATVNDYVSEAARRGCCRQVPYWPSWAKEGTRVFLAHRGDRRRSNEGVIFGYFDLKGVDVVLSQKDCDEYKKITAEASAATVDGSYNLKEFWSSANGRNNLKKFDQFWRKKLPRNRLPFKRRPIKAQMNSQEAEDDSIINFLLGFLISCERRPKTDEHFGYGISTDQTALEEARDCAPDGLRTGPDKADTYIIIDSKRRRKKAGPSFYFVDSLTRWIDEAFCKWLKKEIQKAIRRATSRIDDKAVRVVRADYLAQQRDSAASEWRRRNRQRGVREFEEVLKNAAKLRHGSRILPQHTSFTGRRGAMVLFAKPYPFFRKSPQAAFRGVMRVDGDQLLDRVSKGGKKRARIALRH